MIKYIKGHYIKSILFIFILLVIIFIFINIYNQFGNDFELPDNSVIFEASDTKYCHFSIDDSIDVFEDLTENEYSSIFEQPILLFFKQLHDKYDITVSFYVFYSWDISKNRFNLSQSTDKFKDEFENNSSWLKFGFHAKDAPAYEYLNANIEEEYYNKTVNELERIVGKKSIDYFVRLDRYVADKETVHILKSSGCRGLLIAPDKKRESYALTQQEKNMCYKSDWYVDNCGMRYTPTDVQVEHIKSDSEFYETILSFSHQPRVEIFTHEWVFGDDNSDDNVKKYMKWYAYTMKQNNVEFSFSRD